MTEQDERARTLKEWMAAEQARRDWHTPYFSTGWGDEPLQAPQKVLDDAALAEYHRLEKAATEAREAFLKAWRPTPG